MNRQAELDQINAELRETEAVNQRLKQELAEGPKGRTLKRVERESAAVTKRIAEIRRRLDTLVGRHDGG